MSNPGELFLSDAAFPEACLARSKFVASFKEVDEPRGYQSFHELRKTAREGESGVAVGRVLGFPFPLQIGMMVATRQADGVSPSCQDLLKRARKALSAGSGRCFSISLLTPSGHGILPFFRFLMASLICRSVNTLQDPSLLQLQSLFRVFAASLLSGLSSLFLSTLEVPAYN